jgi:hypothetical protein
MLGSALREGDDAHPAPPGSKVRIAGEERIQFGMGSAPQPSEVGRIEALIRARRIVISVFTRQQADGDITGCARFADPDATPPPGLALR